MDSLKEISGLEDRFLTKPTNELAGEIEYAAVEERIDRMREKSLEFIDGLVV